MFRAGRVDVCDKLGVVFSVDTTKTHGKLLTASIFGSIAWNPSEDRVAYVAEPLYPDIPSFWDTQKECDDNEKEESSNNNSDSNFCWREYWGEQHIGFSSPSVLCPGHRIPQGYAI